MELMTDEISRNSQGGEVLVSAFISTPKYRIKRVEFIERDGSKRFEKWDEEVDDIEAFRKKLKGRRYADVFFVYETRWTD